MFAILRFELICSNALLYFAECSILAHCCSFQFAHFSYLCSSLEMSDSELLNRLKELGLHLTSEGLQVCKDEIKQTQLVSTTATESKLTAQDVFNHAANRSLKGIGAKCLDEKRSTDVLSGLRLLQVVSVRNLSAPEVRQESSAFPRMLDLVLFDGHVRCHAIEHVPVPLLKESALPPGVKILLKDARVFQGVILLEPKSVVKTCGAVDRLAESWKIKQSIEANRSFLQQLQVQMPHRLS